MNNLESDKQPILVSEAHFKSATRVVVAKWLLSRGYSATPDNIQRFGVLAHNKFVMVAGRGVYPLWDFVQDEAAQLSIEMAKEVDVRKRRK